MTNQEILFHIRKVFPKAFLDHNRHDLREPIRFRVSLYDSIELHSLDRVRVTRFVGGDIIVKQMYTLKGLLANLQSVKEMLK